MKPLIVLLLLAPLFAVAASPTASIIQVSGKIKLESNEADPQRDYYLDVGARQGVREGDVYSVYRVVPVLAPYLLGPFDAIQVLLGELKVIAVGEHSCITRTLSLRDSIELPILEYPQFMIGDVAEPKTSLPTP